MVTVSDERVASARTWLDRLTMSGRERQAALGRRMPMAAAVVALALVLPLVATLVWSGGNLRLTVDPILAAVEPTFEAPLSVRSPLGLWLGLLVLGWFGLAYRSRDVRWWEFALVALAGALALPRVGNAWLAGLLMIVPLRRQLARTSAASCVALGAIGLAAASVVLVLTKPLELPAQAQQAAARAPAGSAYVDYRWAAQVPAAQRPFVLDYLRVAQGHERWQAILDAEQVSVLVLDAADRERAAAELVRTSPAWRVTYDDGRVLVAERVQQP